MTLFTRDAAALAEARLLFANLKAQRRAGEVPRLPPEHDRTPEPEPEPETASAVVTVGDIVAAYLRDHVCPRRKLKGAKETYRWISSTGRRCLAW